MNTNVLFIVMSNVLKSTSTKNIKQLNAKIIPYGVLSISTYLNKNCSHDIKIKIIDCNLYEYDNYITLIKNTIKDFEPDIIGISMNYDTSYRHLESMKFIKEDSNNKKYPIVILGGSSASHWHKEILNTYDYIDTVCYLEGESHFYS